MKFPELMDKPEGKNPSMIHGDIHELMELEKVQLTDLKITRLRLKNHRKALAEQEQAEGVDEGNDEDIRKLLDGEF
jgi:hypothetical protein